MPEIGPVELIIICVIAVLILGPGRLALFGSKRDSQSRASSAAGAVQQPWGSGVGPPPGQGGSVMPASDLPPVLTRTYRGKPNEVEVLRSVDAEALARRGYFPSSQSYAAGEWSGSAWILAVVLIFLFGLGLLVLIYMVAVKPAGTLTVFYEQRVAPGIATAVASVSSSPPPPQLAAAATATGAGPATPREATGGVARTGEWEVVESASDYIRSGSKVSVNVDSRVVAVVAKTVSSGIALKEAVAEIAGGQLSLSKGSVRQFVLVPDDPQDLGRVVDAIRARQDPGERREPSIAPAVATTPTGPAESSVSGPPELRLAADDPAHRFEARLATMKRLRATGAISEEEYVARRNKILDEI